MTSLARGCTIRGLWKPVFSLLSTHRARVLLITSQTKVQRYYSTVGGCQTPLIVSCEWLKHQQDSGNRRLRLLDVTYYKDEDERGRQEYERKHIPGAVFLDIFAGAAHTDLIVRNVPDMSVFEESLRAVGVNDDSHVVVCCSEGRYGYYAAGRAAWQMKLFGKDEVSVLDGGLQRWEALGYPVTAEVLTVQRGDFRASHHPALQVSYEEVQQALGKVQLIDSRPAKLYNQVAIKGSVSVPFDLYFKDGVLKPAEEIKQVFAEKGVDLAAPMLATCWIGVTACTLSLVLDYVGVKGVPVYTGSITEWRQRAPEEQMVRGEGDTG